MANSQLLMRRREVLGGTLALLALEIFSPLSAVAQSSPILSGRDERLRAYMLMRGALDGALVISSISCEYFGVVDGVMSHFYDLEAVTFAKYLRAKDGGYDAVSFEIEYFIDRQTGGVLEQWRNPYSGQIVTARHTDSAPVRFRIDKDMRVAMPPALLSPGSEIEREAPLLQSAGNDFWVRERTVATIPVADARPIHFNEAVTYHAKASDLAQPAATRIQSDVSYLGISSFRPWQAMGKRSGHIVGYGVGGSGLELADLQPRWLSISKRLHPEALTNPESFLEPLWKTL